MQLTRITSGRACKPAPDGLSARPANGAANKVRSRGQYEHYAQYSTYRPPTGSPLFIFLEDNVPFLWVFFGWTLVPVMIYGISSHCGWGSITEREGEGPSVRIRWHASTAVSCCALGMLMGSLWSPFVVMHSGWCL